MIKGVHVCLSLRLYVHRTSGLTSSLLVATTVTLKVTQTAVDVVKIVAADPELRSKAGGWRTEEGELQLHHHK